MGDRTAIAWSDATWNPIRGCSRVSEGCRNCYAERVAARFSGPGQPYEGLIRRKMSLANGGPRWNGEVRLVPEKLDEPLRWKRPRRIFVNSMSDLFHEKVPDEWIAAIFGVMAAAPQHTFQVLTKRAERMRAWFAAMQQDAGPAMHVALAPLLSQLEPAGYEEGAEPAIVRRNDAICEHLCELDEWPLLNVHIGVSVEDQATADERIPILLKTPAAVRWVSAEPLLGPVDMARWLRCQKCQGAGLYDEMVGRGSTMRQAVCLCRFAGGYPAMRGLDWIVVGGESGPGARPFDVSWARSVIEQCRAAGVPVFVKQLGAWPEEELARVGNTSSVFAYRLKHRAGADPSEWPADLRVQEFPR